MASALQKWERIAKQTQQASEPSHPPRPAATTLGSR